MFSQFAQHHSVRDKLARYGGNVSERAYRAQSEKDMRRGRWEKAYQAETRGQGQSLPGLQLNSCQGHLGLLVFCPVSRSLSCLLSSSLKQMRMRHCPPCLLQALLNELDAVLASPPPQPQAPAPGPAAQAAAAVPQDELIKPVEAELAAEQPPTDAAAAEPKDESKDQPSALASTEESATAEAQDTVAAGGSATEHADEAQDAGAADSSAEQERTLSNGELDSPTAPTSPFDSHKVTAEQFLLPDPDTGTDSSKAPDGFPTQVTIADANGGHAAAATPPASQHGTPTLHAAAAQRKIANLISLF